MNRAKRAIIRLLRIYIEQGREGERRRGMLKGGGYHKTKCLEKAQKYLALVLQSKDDAPRPWKRSALDSIIRDARKTAGSLKIDCKLRLVNLEYLMQAEGLLPATDDATSQLIKSLIAPAPKSEPATQNTAQTGSRTVAGDLLDFSGIGRNE